MTQRINYINIKFETQDYSVVDYDRMFLYIWIDSTEEQSSYDNNTEFTSKFGQRFVPAGTCPVADCAKRVYEQLATRKDLAKIDQRIDLVAIFDATVVANDVNMMNKKSKFDDHLREQIGFVKNSETHYLSGSEMKGKVADLLHKHGQPLPVCNLSTMQQTAAIETLDIFEAGMKVVLAELCARFGKTLYSSVVALESHTQLTVIASYVQTSITSYKNDVKMFAQFADIVCVDTMDEDYQDQISQAFAEGKNVFAFLSLCPGELRNDRIEFLFTVPVTSRQLIIDEADFGAHTKNQADILIKYTSLCDVTKVLIMTGTGAERAVSNWKIDHVISVTYAELIHQKRQVQKAG